MAKHGWIVALGLLVWVACIDWNHAQSVFSNRTTTLSVTRNGTGDGLVFSSPAGIQCGTTCSGDFSLGSTVVLSASADAGSDFTGWNGRCSGKTCTVRLDGPTQVSATFMLPWTFTSYDFSGSDNTANAVAADPAGNVFAVGNEYLSDGGHQAGWIRKLDSNGNLIWHDDFDGGMLSSTAQAVTADSTGNAFMIGTAVYGGLSWNAWIRKYGPDGGTLWTQPVMDGGGLNSAAGIALDPSGNVLISGTANISPNPLRMWLGKLSANGNLIWINLYPDPANNSYQNSGVASDTSGNFLAVGTISIANEGEDIWLGKYDPTGALLWKKVENGAAGRDDEGKGIASDPQGNVLVTGSEDTDAGGTQIWVRKYDPNGNVLWTQWYGNPSDYSQGRAIVCDDAGYVFVTGLNVPLGGAGNIWTGKLDPAGNLVAPPKLYPAKADGNIQGNGIALDSQGNILVAGEEPIAGQHTQVWIRKYFQ